MLRIITCARMIDKDKYPSFKISSTIDTDQAHLLESNMKKSVSSKPKVFQKIAPFILPSFILSRLSSSTCKPQRVHPTSYLDGLRGVASFIVFMGHYTEESIGWFTEPYGLYEDGASSSVLQLPFVRVLYSPRPMVHIFFIISGFILAYKPLKQIHSQQLSAFVNTLSSSVLRRGIRLFFPSFAIIFMMSIAVSLGISDSRYTSVDGNILCHIQNALMSCWKLLGSSWAIDSLDNGHPEYNPALWSMPVEFSQSLLLYISVLGLSRCKSTIRLVILTVILWYCFKSGHIFTMEFLGGFFLAELNLIQDRTLITPLTSPTLLPEFDLKIDDTIGKKDRLYLKKILIQVFWIMNLVSGLFISSWTNYHFDEVWGIAFLSRNTPEPYDVWNGQKVWFCLAGFQIVAACTQLSWLKKILTMAIPQYLGNISFSLYLTHNLCLTILEPKFVPILEKSIGKGTLWERQLFWAVGLAIYLPIIITVSDLFWRMIDIPVVKFAYWFESKCVVKKKF